ncbi:unnamed protein product [Chironomus riparius]|uniref:Uncharacterized protein n=1 Tax=Chironomus riparius TaxID=315576 RepID=A0A9N9WSH0_9DIPT|nr:unnamed protein product [Chironomus riparius]
MQSWLILLIFFTLTSVKAYDVYRNIQKEYGYLEHLERQNEISTLLNEMNEDMDFGLEFDAWDSNKEPKYKL